MRTRSLILLIYSEADIFGWIIGGRTWSFTSAMKTMKTHSHVQETLEAEEEEEEEEEEKHCDGDSCSSASGRCWVTTSAGSDGSVFQQPEQLQEQKQQHPRAVLPPPTSLSIGRRDFFAPAASTASTQRWKLLTNALLKILHAKMNHQWEQLVNISMPGPNVPRIVSFLSKCSIELHLSYIDCGLNGLVWLCWL